MTTKLTLTLTMQLLLMEATSGLRTGKIVEVTPANKRTWQALRDRGLVQRDYIRSRVLPTEAGYLAVRGLVPIPQYVIDNADKAAAEAEAA